MRMVMMIICISDCSSNDTVKFPYNYVAPRGLAQRITPRRFIRVKVDSLLSCWNRQLHDTHREKRFMIRQAQKFTSLAFCIWQLLGAVKVSSFTHTE